MSISSFHTVLNTILSVLLKKKDDDFSSFHHEYEF